MSESCSLGSTVMQEYDAIVLDGKSTMLEYHKQEGDPNASVSAWQDNQRLITFSVPLTGVPELVKQAIGGETAASSRCATHSLHCRCPESC